MTKQEFENRVRVQVCNKEFDAINDVYMNCDLDKDAFCKMWKRINKKHIAELQAAKEQAERRNFLIAKLREIKEKILRTWRWYPALLTDEEAAWLEEAGINVAQNDNNICFDICTYIG